MELKYINDNIFLKKNNKNIIPFEENIQNLLL